MWKTFVFLSLFYTFSEVSSLYFHIGETERKCFIEEIPDDTMVVGKFVKIHLNMFVYIEPVHERVRPGTQTVISL